MSLCWWCCHSIPGDVLQMPVCHERQTDSFVLRGSFCSWECMKAHVAEKWSERKRGIINGNIMLLRRRMYGRGSLPCRPAPHFSHLEQFGGEMKINEFRKQNVVDIGPLNRAVNTDTSQRGVVQVVSIQPTPAQTSTATGKMWEINSVQTNNQPLRLKREKPLKRDQNNLASMLGLKKTSS